MFELDALLFGSNLVQNGFVSAVQAHPTDSNIIMNIGAGFVKLYRFGEGVLRSLPVNLKHEPQTYKSMCWINEDRLAIGTEEGSIFIFENGDCKVGLATSPGEGVSVDVLMSVGIRGFLAGCSNGHLRLYTRSEDSREYYTVVQDLAMPQDDSGILCLTKNSRDGDRIAITTRAGQMYMLALAGIETAKVVQHWCNCFVLMTWWSINSLKTSKSSH